MARIYGIKETSLSITAGNSSTAIIAGFCLPEVLFPKHFLSCRENSVPVSATSRIKRNVVCHFKKTLMEEKTIEFAKLKYAYITVKKFLTSKSGENNISLKTRVFEDLGLSGDDNYYMLDEFIQKFELEHAGFECNKHFHSEAEVADPTNALFNLLILSVWLPMKTIELLTANNVKLDKPKFWKVQREVSNMNFRQFLTWYVEGKYEGSESVKYKLEI
jgi:hypothetical protein